MGQGDRIAAEQAALHRVAMLVASGAAPEELFTAVAAEVGQLLDVDSTLMSRYDAQGVATVVGGWSSTGGVVAPVGSRFELGGRDVHTLVFQTGRGARIDDYSGSLSALAELTRARGVRSTAGVPISVAGRAWGIVVVATTQEVPLPPDTEARLAGFTELVAIAIANAQARLDLRGFAEEQAALRRVATLVAGGAPPEEVFTAVTEEIGQVLDVDLTVMVRYDPDAAATVLGTWTRTGADVPLPVDGRVPLGGRNVTTQVFETGRPARLDSYADASGAAADTGRGWGLRSFVGVPISVDGRLWGMVIAAYTHEEPLPPDTEARLAGFTKLVATAIANAESQAQLTASRARIVTAADQARRRIERDLHDGAQQRLISVTLQLQAARAAVPSGADELRAHLDDLVAEASSALDELRELARGIHPAILAEGGLPPALRALARRCAVPVRLEVRVERRLPEPVEIAVYYLVAEALTNAAKHADAARVDVRVTIVSTVAGEVLRVSVDDDGGGGADPGGGSGLVGLTDRVEALGGRLQVRSPVGGGTSVLAELPLRPDHPVSD